MKAPKNSFKPFTKQRKNKMEDMSIKIILRIGDEDIELTIDEAKRLFDILKDLFKEEKEEKTETGGEPYRYWPMPFSPYPYRHPYPYPINPYDGYPIYTFGAAEIV